MSVLYDAYERACYVCGQRSWQIDWDETSLPDHDLDGRPTIDGHWDLTVAHMESCSHCGYVSRDISVGQARDELIVNSPEFQRLWADESIPDYARCFLRLALLFDETRLGRAEAAYGRACWQQVAAWACENVGDVDGGRMCREMAIQSMMDSRAAGSHRSEDDLVVIADNLRRCTHFEAALEWIARSLDEVTDVGVRARLEFERQLVLVQDLAPHLRDEAPGPKTMRDDMSRQGRGGQQS